VDRGVREDGLRDARCADGPPRELLDVSRLLGVLSAADDVAERNRKILTAERAPEVLVQRRTEHVGGGGLRGRHRDRDRAVGADRGEVIRPVGGAQCVVDGALVARIDAFEAWNRVLAGLRDGFVGRGSIRSLRTRRSRPPLGAAPAAEAAGLGEHVGLDGGVAARVEHATQRNAGNSGHQLDSLRTVKGSAPASYSSAATRIGSV